MPAITRIANERMAVEVSSLGAEMQSLRTADGRDYLWDGEAEWWTGRSPILFPIVGKAPDNRILIEGKPYEMNQHGFARRSEFSLVASDATSCRYELQASETSRAGYPFEFSLSVTHALQGAKLTVTAEVENRDTRPMPFGLGYHSAFLWPLPGGEGKAHTITLDNGAEPALTRLTNGLIGPQKLPSPFKAGHLVVDHAMFEDDAMIFLEGAGEGLSYAAAGTDAVLKFTFENLPNLALWQKPGAPFLCIEPWHGTAAELGSAGEIEKRPYGVTLAPGQMARFAFSVELPA